MRGYLKFYLQHCFSAALSHDIPQITYLSFIIALMLLPVAAASGREYLLHETLETGKADICLVDLVKEPQSLNSSERSALSRFCPIMLPRKETRLKAAELEIYFYQAGIYPANIGQDVVLLPRLRSLTQQESLRLGITHKNLLVPAEAELIAYRPPQGRHRELRILGRGGRFYTWETFSLPMAERLPAGTPVTLRYENNAVLIEISGRLAHTARPGEKVTMTAYGRNFRGLLADNETVLAE